MNRFPGGRQAPVLEHDQAGHTESKLAQGVVFMRKQASLGLAGLGLSLIVLLSGIPSARADRDSRERDAVRDEHRRRRAAAEDRRGHGDDDDREQEPADHERRMLLAETEAAKVPHSGEQETGACGILEA